MTFLLLAALLAFDLAAIRNEPNPERRCELALAEADVAVTAAQQAYASDNLEKTRIALDEVGEAVDLAHQSLTASGKDPRRNPKRFKSAELSVRKILRRLEGLRDAMNSADRELVDPVRERAGEVRDALILGIMGKKR